jgi:hypothetical protein
MRNERKLIEIKHLEERDRFEQNKREKQNQEQKR